MGRNTGHSPLLLVTDFCTWQVLSLSGVARVFVTKRTLLHTLGDFPKAWRLLLENIEKLALSATQEVSLAALKAFHEMVVTGEVSGEGGEEGARWQAAWRTWLAIGQQATKPNLNEDCSPTQAFLTSLCHIFPLLLPHLRPLPSSSLASLSSVLLATLALPVTADSELGYLLTAEQASLLPLHCAIAKCCQVVEAAALAGASDLLPGLFTLYISLGKLVHKWPEGAGKCGVKGIFPEKFILLGERCLVAAGRLYERTHGLEVVVQGKVILEMVAALRPVLELKYSCIKQSSWKVAIEVLLACVGVSLETGGGLESQADLCAALAPVLEAFLFPKVHKYFLLFLRVASVLHDVDF